MYLWPGDTLYMGIFAVELLLLHLGVADLNLSSGPSRTSHFMPVTIQRRPCEWKLEREGDVLPIHTPHNQFHRQQPGSLHMSHSVPYPSCTTQVSVTNGGTLFTYVDSLRKHINLPSTAWCGSDPTARQAEREHSFSDLTTREQSGKKLRHVSLSILIYLYRCFPFRAPEVKNKRWEEKLRKVTPI